jgi:tetratricopeptide (TPR) repeat protein
MQFGEPKMNLRVFLAVTAIAAVICVCLIILNVKTGKKASYAALELQRSAKAMADLKGKIHKAQLENNSANQKVEELEQKVSGLVKQRNADRLLIESLWNMLLRNTRSKERQGPGEQNTVKQNQEEGARYDKEKKSVKYDIGTVREIIESGGSIENAIRQIVTSDTLSATLQEHSDEPSYWVAAASLEPNNETALTYLEEAASLYPESVVALSSLVEAQITRGQTGESTLACIDKIRTLDPTNALADCYAAYCQFANGDVKGALKSLSQAGTKDRFADDRIELLMARYDYFLNAGVSDAVAIGLSAFDLPLSHMSMLRDMGRYSIEQASALSAAGQYEDALQLVKDVSNVGSSLSSSGRFIVYDRVGMALQKSAFEEQKRIYEAIGNVRQAQEIGLQLQAIEERSASIDVMVMAFGGVQQSMTEQDIADYVNGTMLNGEFSTLQNMPEIAKALAQARKEKNSQLPQISPPSKIDADPCLP